MTINVADTEAFAGAVLQALGIAPSHDSADDLGPDDPIAWIESEFYVPELKGPIVLEPYQRAVLREAYRKDENGRYIYDLVLWSDIKKSIKSTIAGAVILERASRLEQGTIKVVANDLEQANSRVFEAITKAIKLNPRLRRRCRIKTYKITLWNGTTIQAIPVDPKGEAGGNDDMIEFTELHAASNKAAVLMWSEMRLSPTKHGYSQVWIDTYAGHSGESPILEPLYEQIVKDENRITLADAPADLDVYRLGAFLCLWNKTPRCPWQTPEYYASEAGSMTPEEYSRVHGNEWVSSTAKFIEPEWWYACQVAELPAMDKYLELAVAIDAGVTSDNFAIVATSRKDDQVMIRFYRVWIPPKDGKLNFSNVNDPNDQDYPEGVLRWLAATYNVIVFGYDESQLHHLCTSLRNDGVGFFEPFSQGVARLKADKQLYDMIKARKIQHTDPKDGALTAHVLNANRKTEAVDGDNKLRIIKRSASRKIDLAVATSMSADLALRNLAP